jgi:hypothetical protein
MKIKITIENTFSDFEIDDEVLALVSNEQRAAFISDWMKPHVEACLLLSSKANSRPALEISESDAEALLECADKCYSEGFGTLPSSVDEFICKNYPEIAKKYAWMPWIKDLLNDAQ